MATSRSQGMLWGLALLAVILAYYLAYDRLGLGHYLSIEGFKAHIGAIKAWQQAAPWTAFALYFGAFVLSAAISFPGAILLIWPAGPLFGLFWGTVIASFASSIGAWLAFLTARHLLRGPVTRILGERMGAINELVDKDGVYYLFTLRMAPVLPFFVVNLVMGLTPMRSVRFYWVSQVGMLAGTALTVNASCQLAQVGSVADLFTPAVCLSLALLSIFPWLVRRFQMALGRG
jgi:uncharacterized membrane protein YdjX (TVP38/TMEM64 family)